MGADIFSKVEFRNEAGEWEVAGKVFTDKWGYKKGIPTDNPFNWNSYALSAFLGKEDNKLGVTPIKFCDMPVDAKINTHGNNFIGGRCLYLKDLLESDNEQTFLVHYQTPTDGDPIIVEEHVSYRDILGSEYFEVIEELKALGTGDNVRVYCWFSF